MWCKSHELPRLAHLIITCQEHNWVSGEGERVGGYFWEIAHYFILILVRVRHFGKNKFGLFHSIKTRLRLFQSWVIKSMR